MNHTARTTLSWLILAALLVGCMILCITGCTPVTVPPPSLESASTRLDVIREEAERIIREATAGAAEIPEAGQRFGTIAQSGEQIVTQAGEARSEVGQGQKQLATAIAKIDRLQSEQGQMLEFVKFLGICAIPAAVFIALWLKWYSFSAALAVAGLAAIVVASVVGKLVGVWPWIGGALVLAIVWLGVETAIRMQREALPFRAALWRSVRTAPWVDFQDLFNGDSDAEP